MNYYPNCGSGKNNQDEEILQCLNCNQRWNPDFLWLYKSFKYFTSNLISQYNQSDDSEKIKINEQLMSSAKKRSSAFKIKDDVKSTNMLLLSTMEELIEGITMILSETIPDSFSYLHEVKLTPYLIYIKILRKKNYLIR